MSQYFWLFAGSGRGDSGGAAAFVAGAVAAATVVLMLLCCCVKVHVRSVVVRITLGWVVDRCCTPR